MKILLKKIFFGFFLLWVGIASGVLGCAGDEGPDLMLFPTIVVVDSPNNRVFVIDNQGNRMNLIDPTTNQPFTREDNRPLLDNQDPLLLPAFPSNAALASLPGGLSRIFVLGGGAGPSQQITVLDFTDGGGLTTSPISPITVPGGPLDVLVGIAVDPDSGLVFVSNSTSGQVHAFNVNTGAEATGSPLNIGGTPTQLAVDPVSDLLAVASSATTMVSFVNLLDLTAVVQILDVGVLTRDVAVASNASGTILFLSGSAQNIAKAFNLNLTDLSLSTQIFETVPTPPSVPLPDPNFLTGNLNFVAAGNLTDGRMAGFFTQSSGDVLVYDLSSNLATLTPAIIIVGALSGEGIASFQNFSGQILNVYYASPGLGVLTVVDPLTNTFIDQIP